MKNLLLRSALLLLFVYFQPVHLLLAQEEEYEELDPRSQTKFVNELPIPAIMEPTFSRGKKHFPKPDKASKLFYEVSITQFKQELGLYDESGKPLETTVWGYNGQYPGPTIEATKGIPVFVKWENKLVDNHGRPLQHHLKIDRSIHWANPHKGVPLVTHLHGAILSGRAMGFPMPGTPRTSRKKESYGGRKSTNMTINRRLQLCGITIIRWGSQG